MTAAARYRVGEQCRRFCEVRLDTVVEDALHTLTTEVPSNFAVGCSKKRVLGMVEFPRACMI